jgi:hypothetical protein
MLGNAIRRASLFLGLMFVAPVAQAQVVELICTRGSVAWNVVVDYGRSVVTDKTNPSRPLSYPAQVSNAQTRWNVDWGGGDVRPYVLNRVSGELNYCDKTGCYPFQCQKAEEVKPKY